MKRELTSQGLLDRYIYALKIMLPPDKMEDIAAEVRSNLESQIEDRSMALGRDLRLDELSAMLKQRGHPAKVALQYREKPARSLIGPALFPFYWFSLRAVLILWLTIRLIVAVFAFQGTSPARTILLTLGRDVLIASIIIPTGVTLVFAISEYLEFKYRYSERWKPEALAPIPPHRQPPKPQPIVSIIGGVTWLIFLALAFYSPSFFWVWGGRGVFSASETLYAMRFPLWLLVFFGFSQSWLGYTRFAAGKWHRFQRLGVISAGVVFAIYLLSTGDLLVAGPRWDLTQAKPLATLNQMIAGVLALACILAGLALLQKFIRIIRRWNSHTHGGFSVLKTAWLAPFPRIAFGTLSC